MKQRESEWNLVDRINYDKEHQIITSFNVHLENLEQLKRQKKLLIDNGTPSKFIRHRDILNSKPLKEREYIIQVENNNLVTKLEDIQRHGSQYKDSLRFNVPHKITPRAKSFVTSETERNIELSNKALKERISRIKQDGSTIKVKSFEQQFKSIQKYKKNLMGRSRRIVNCMKHASEMISSTMSNKSMKMSKGWTQKQFPGAIIEEKENEISMTDGHNYQKSNNATLHDQQEQHEENQKLDKQQLTEKHPEKALTNKQRVLSKDEHEEKEDKQLVDESDKEKNTIQQGEEFHN